MFPSCSSRHRHWHSHLGLHAKSKYDRAFICIAHRRNLVPTCPLPPSSHHCRFAPNA